MPQLGAVSNPSELCGGVPLRLKRVRLRLRRFGAGKGEFQSQGYRNDMFLRSVGNKILRVSLPLPNGSYLRDFLRCQNEFNLIITKHKTRLFCSF